MRIESSFRWFSTHCVSTRTSFAYPLISATSLRFLCQPAWVYPNDLTMEHAPLRPVPAHLTGPVDMAAVEAAARGVLPALDELPARALALVALAGRPRREAALRLQTDEDELAVALALARKALRRTLVELPGSGWCERAERLVSDRLDASLDVTGAARLDVHLRNCPRCVEHERRLVQATDALLAGVAREPRPGPAVPPTELVPVGDAVAPQ